MIQARDMAACHETLRAARGIDAAKADDASDDASVTARAVEQHAFHVNHLIVLGADGPRVKQGDVRNDCGQGEQAEKIEFSQGCRPFLLGIRYGIRPLDGDCSP